jgi:hypothetical protein
MPTLVTRVCSSSQFQCALCSVRSLISISPWTLTILHTLEPLAPRVTIGERPYLGGCLLHFSFRLCRPNPCHRERHARTSEVTHILLWIQISSLFQGAISNYTGDPQEVQVSPFRSPCSYVEPHTPLQKP